MEVGEFTGSHHSKAGRILGSLDNVLAEVVEGNRGLKTAAFPQGNSAAAVNGCWQCHGSEVKVLGDGTLDPVTWPNTGIGRINPDGSEGSCSACHSRHSFSAAQAREPDNCGKCHMGPDHPQIEIYNESKHGIAFRANVDKMAMTSSKWVLGEDYSVAPTCATCHMSAAKGVKDQENPYPDQPVTHDVGMRISWNNRPALSVRPEISDGKMGLPGKDTPWTVRRGNMVGVCINCHNRQFVDAFYVQYDGLIELYHDKFAEPGLALYKASEPLRRKPKFSDPIDWTWFEIWHHEGRRARHGASMMGPDYTHWHGTYEIARHFYTKFIPELEELVEHNLHAEDPDKQAAAQQLQVLIEETLNSENHQWYLNKMSPAEAARREAARQEFQKRYK
jgi:cytochrome c553